MRTTSRDVLTATHTPSRSATMRVAPGPIRVAPSLRPVSVSKRSTSGRTLLVTQTAPPASATPLGRWPTGIVSDAAAFAVDGRRGLIAA